MIKKIFCKLGLAALLITSVAACSSTTPNDDTDTAETGVLPVIFDRMGRPGVSTAVIADTADKDAYNRSGNPAEWPGLFTAALTERATIIDNLDGVVGNSLLTPSTIADLLVDDRLRIDTSIPECNIYLSLEIGLGGCGGRTLDRDVINDTLQHLVSQTNPVDDLADNDSVFLTDWPFIGVAN